MYQLDRPWLLLALPLLRTGCGGEHEQGLDWGMVKFRISVSYDTDVEKARKLTKKIGIALAENPEFAPLFMELLNMKDVGGTRCANYLTRRSQQTSITP